MDEVTLFVERIVPWSALVGAGLRIVLILLVSWVLLLASRRIIPALRRQMQRRASDPGQLQRIETLARVVRYVVTAMIAVITVMLVLAEFGVSIAPLLASAGVVGIAIGFGAQSLIKDYFNGLFLLLEDQVRQGDVVELGGKAGLVEEVTLRHIRLRDYDGNVHYVPSGVVTTVSNSSRGFAYAVMNVRVGYREDVDAVFEAMREVGAAMREDAVLAGMILDDLEIAGVDAWGDCALVLLCRIRVQPLQQWTVRREFLRRLGGRFEQLGIEVPYPRITLSRGENPTDPIEAA